jgi:RNA polymerase sigma factor (sigma-70 family)
VCSVPRRLAGSRDDWARLGVLGVVEDSTGGEVQVNAQQRPFEVFVAVEGTRLRRALVASYGVEAGSDACAEALAWAWEHWSSVVEMSNPVGYLFRVGQSAARRLRHQTRRVTFPSERRSDESDTGEVGVRLDAALVGLSSQQRVVALLVHGHGYTYGEVAEITGASVASVRSDLHRAMKRLRQRLDER